MDLLPKDFDEFRSVDYWDRFFRDRGQKPFEWYGEWEQIKEIASSLCLGKNVLMVGCGNSEISSQMYDDGINNVTNIDFSKVVIREMLVKNARERPKMKWMVMDMTNMKFSAGQFDVIFDKGGLDALMGEDNEKAGEAGRKLLAEVARVLNAKSGMYLCITLAQNHVLKKLLGSFLYGWKIEFQKVMPSPDMLLSPLQPFMAVISRSDSIDDLPLVELNFSKGGYGRNAEQVKDIIKIVEEENAARNKRESLCASGPTLRDFDKVHPGRSVSLTLPLEQADNPKYRAYVLDPEGVSSAALGCVVFIVPQGREHDWLYASEEGQAKVAEQCNARRVIMVAVAPGNSVTSLQAVQDELSPIVQPLIPSSVRFQPKAVPYVSASEGIGKRVIRERKTSEISDQIVVEDVELEDGKCVRRMVFGRNQSLIQSEATLMVKCDQEKGKGKKGGSASRLPPASQLSIVFSDLSCLYHEAIIAGLALMPTLRTPRKDTGTGQKTKGLLIGLGGGGLPMFLRNNYVMSLEIVELDEAVAHSAESWFGFKASKDLRLKLGDGLLHVENMAKDVSDGGETEGVLDVLIVDAGGADNSLGISCPPPPFLEDDFLKSSSKVLGSTGMIVFNCVARSQAMYEKACKSIGAFFPFLYEMDVDDDVNRVLFGLQCEVDLSLDARMWESRLLQIAKDEWLGDFDVGGFVSGIKKVNV